MKETYRELALAFKESKSETIFNRLYAKIKPGITNYVFNIVRNADATEDIVADTLSKLYTHIDSYDPHFEITTWMYRIARNSAIQFIYQQKAKISLDKFKEWGFDATENSSGDISVGMNAASEGGFPTDHFFGKTEEDYIEESQILLRKKELVVEAIGGLKMKYRKIMEDRFINKLSYQAIVDKNNDPIDLKIDTLLEEIGRVESPEDKKKLYFTIERAKRERITLQTVKNRINRGRKSVQDILLSHPLFKDK
jgi:RNA polymerase sigma factor (sigma-70 family)